MLVSLTIINQQRCSIISKKGMLYCNSLFSPCYNNPKFMSNKKMRDSPKKKLPSIVREALLLFSSCRYTGYRGTSFRIDPATETRHHSYNLSKSEKKLDLTNLRIRIATIVAIAIDEN
jgi:hypothetical protein